MPSIFHLVVSKWMCNIIPSEPRSSISFGISYKLGLLVLPFILQVLICIPKFFIWDHLTDTLLYFSAHTETSYSYKYSIMSISIMRIPGKSFTRDMHTVQMRSLLHSRTSFIFTSELSGWTPMFFSWLETYKEKVCSKQILI